MAKILLQFTKNYDLFELKEDNRDVIDQNHIRDLMGSMERNGFLKSGAISVKNHGSKYVVLNGQHRLEAAKRLGISVWYTVDDEIPEDALPDLQISKKWLPKDFLKHFVVKGLKPYIKLKEISEAYPKVSITTIVILLEGGSKTGSRKRFERGVLKINNLDKALQALAYANQIHGLYKQEWLFERTFLGAFIRMLDIPGYNQKQMLDKLKYRSEDFRQMLSEEGYYKMWDQIYNYKTRANKVAFIWNKEK